MIRPGGGGRLVGALAAIAVLAACSSAFAQPGETIAAVAVSGNTLTDERLILNTAGLRAGEVLTAATLQDAVRRLYGLKLFDDIVIEGDRTGAGIAITIRVEEFPRVQRIHYTGNKKLKPDDFSLSLRAGQVIGPHQLREAINTIESAYHAEGYFLADVSGSIDRGDTLGLVAVTFTIAEGGKVGVESVVIEGNTLLTDGELTKKMKNKPSGFIKSIFGGAKFNREQFADDLESIVQRYRKHGFIDAFVVSDTVILDDERKNASILVTVNEGGRYYFGPTTFSGNELHETKVLQKALRYDEGDVYNEEKYNESLERLYTLYQEDGYLYVRLIDDVRTADSTVTIAFEVSEGVPAHVHRIDITGNTKTKDKVIRRELAIVPGQTFRRSALMRSLRNVMQLNYFGNVIPDYRSLPNGDVDLEIKVEEKPTGQVQVGAGYSGQDKFVGTVGMGIPNFRGNGQNLSFSLDFGKRRQSYNLAFTEPWFLDTPTTVGFDLFQTDRTWDDPTVSGSTSDYVEERDGFGLLLGRRLRFPDDYFRIFWNYRYRTIGYKDFSDQYIESAVFFDTTGYVTDTIPDPDNPGEFLVDTTGVTRDESGIRDPFSLYNQSWPQATSSVSWTISRDSRDLPEFATRGSRASYRLEFAGGVLGGRWSYTRHEFSYAWYHPVIGNLVLAPRWKVGALLGGTGVNSIPHTDRYYAGGIRSDGMIRGYDEGDILAVIDNTDRPSGGLMHNTIEGSNALVRGRSIATMNLELQFPVAAQQLYLLGFIDAGNVWLDPTDISPFSDMKTSYGMGFRLVLPGIGIMGFDFGAPFSGENKGQFKPHFQIGGNF